MWAVSHIRILAIFLPRNTPPGIAGEASEPLGGVHGEPRLSAPRAWASAGVPRHAVEVIYLRPLLLLDALLGALLINWCRVQ